MNELLKILLQSRNASRRAIKQSSFEYNSHLLVSSKIIVNYLSKINGAEESIPFFSFLCVNIFARNFKCLVLQQFKNYKSKLLKTMNSENKSVSVNSPSEQLNRKIHGIIGWGIYESEKNLIKQNKNAVRCYGKTSMIMTNEKDI